MLKLLVEDGGGVSDLLIRGSVNRDTRSKTSYLLGTVCFLFIGWFSGLNRTERKGKGEGKGKGRGNKEEGRDRLQKMSNIF